MAKILIIEDNPANLKLARFLLEKAKHHVLEAGTAEAGIALAGAERPDLILMDIQLPGMDGLEATRRLKADERLHAIKVHAFTGLVMKGDREKIFEAGCDGYIAKPISIDNFLKEIDSALAGD
jgi:two-component system, cell cycle response regulator DivK